MVFVREGVEREPAQNKFVGEVESWEQGHFRAAYTSSDDLRKEVAKAIHQWELSTAVAPVDPAEMLVRANELVAQHQRLARRRSEGTLLGVAISGGPAQQILRPAEIEQPELARSIIQQAMFGEAPIFSVAHGSDTSVSGGRLFLCQENGNSVSVDEGGTLLMVQALTGTDGSCGVIIEEEVSEKLRSALACGSWVLERIDPSRRLSRFVPTAHLPIEGYCAWRTRAEHNRSPNTVTYSHGFRERGEEVVHLQPPDRARAALTFERDRIAEDLLVLLRRQLKQ